MKKVGLFLFVALFAVAGCSSKKDVSSSDARAALEEKYKNKVGIATKNDFVQEYGNAEWCRAQGTGEETCRFYIKKGTKWLGDKKDRKSYDAFEEIVADFDANGVLKGYKANAQK